MNVFVLICLSLQLLVAPVCQAAMSCGQGMADGHHQTMGGHDAHRGFVATEEPAAIDCDHCDDASMAGDNQTLAVLPGFEPGHDAALTVNFVPRGDIISADTRAPPDAGPDPSGSLWLQTRRIRL